MPLFVSNSRRGDCDGGLAAQRAGVRRRFTAGAGSIPSMGTWDVWRGGRIVFHGRKYGTINSDRLNAPSLSSASMTGRRYGCRSKDDGGSQRRGWFKRSTAAFASVLSHGGRRTRISVVCVLGLPPLPLEYDSRRDYAEETNEHQQRRY